jgi:MOSC domain-containing protein YiiM/SAM-dependent methyltransferase
MTDGMHDAAFRGFAAAADAYERARPVYPADAVATIVDRLDLRPGRSVLELGAGTGKLTRLLVPSGARVMALEPVAPMRAKLAAAPAVELIEGTAESIPLAASSVDGVVVAQAFHWFDAVRALSEIHRVLRPGGRLLLAWNFRDESVPWVRELGALTHRLIRDEPQAWHRAWRDALARCALFPPFEVAMFRHVHALTPEAVLDRVASVSYIAAAAPEARAGILGEVAALLARDPATAGRATVDLPYTTEIMWAERRSPTPSMTGIVASANMNRGGVPKPPVDGARIGPLGLEGDGHNDPEPVHGGPDQAVSLYSQEAIEKVRADGHAAFPGAYGENLTLLGIDWSLLHAGSRLAVGDDEDGVILELTEHAAPCQTIAHWFVDRRIGRISPAAHPKDARWYARVLREGPVEPGMAVRVVTTP